MKKMISRMLLLGIFIFIICYSLITISLHQTTFHSRGGLSLDENSFEELDNIDYYQGFFIETRGFIKPKISHIELFKKNGENFVDLERLLIDIYNHTGSTSIEELKENRDNYMVAENFIPGNKEFNLVIKNDSDLRLYEIEELKIYYSFFGVKAYKFFALDYK